ncbi:hypothetical protein RM704_27330 [Streptomyces sp. DSM 3412]|uniref:Uncharacterized protein n=1 Tax=Streptomyces gottesmaniae TaxID=3075518 RepID=A0ABU2Z3I2_9ACTN|nr:hypothetical protein [Streptomyces sp. DSM 3412]MDT0571133.1 hypothetical protein [Streptomyces sp. DSM 3412]
MTVAPPPPPDGDFSAYDTRHMAILIMRNCDGCDRGSRSAGHSRCRDCRSRDQLPVTG